MTNPNVQGEAIVALSVTFTSLRTFKYSLKENALAAVLLRPNWFWKLKYIFSLQFDSSFLFAFLRAIDLVVLWMQLQSNSLKHLMQIKRRWNLLMR